ncbi:hypothetical protein F3Y22_tig00110925pilonHSYRG00047 [Hibiscus syriacus]|uniref:Uncharacterized protein n=1 Tax=Hibiscus syriacus TaxID=106335 RepID=A0A6A2ZDQ6_HIBSY|nr:hypothetical protein F3Y22_tig00110925pilonHSYRG00047 [Hibiscus syriacus]
MQRPCLDFEPSALLQLEESFVLNRSASAFSKDDSWKLEEWIEGDCCSWDGVECVGNTGHVIGLDLSSSFLYGYIDSNSSLFQLHHLTRLNLSDNDFYGSEIPSAIGNLSMLSQLDLSNSVFSELRNPNLKSLAERLVNLEHLDLDGVIASSVVPRSLASMSSLTYLSLRSCELHGEFPNEVFQLPHFPLISLQ